MRLIKRSQREREKKNVFKIEIKADFNDFADLSAFLFNNLNENARNEFKYTCQCYKLERGKICFIYFMQSIKLNVYKLSE